MSSSLDFTVQDMTVTGLEQVRGRFQGATRRLHNALSGILRDEGEQIAELARARMASLFKNPGRMQASIQVNAEEEIAGSSAFTQVEVTASGLPYLRIHEYGGFILTPDIWKYMRFATARWSGYVGSSSEVFTQHTRAHVTPIPERSYLRYALAQRAAAIRERVAEAGSESVR